DAYFQWWRHGAAGTWSPEAVVRVVDSVSASTAYYRTSLTRDSLGRIWVLAWLLHPRGASSAQVAVSTDGGRTFVRQPSLAQTSVRGGGILISLGTRMLFLYDQQNGAPFAHFRVRDDAAELGSWGPIQQAFGEGIYHGASLSAVPDDLGGLHLVY